MPKITFMGAGSSVFAKNVLGDCMTSPIMENSEIALYDIDRVAGYQEELAALEKEIAVQQSASKE